MIERLRSYELPGFNGRRIIRPISAALLGGSLLLGCGINVDGWNQGLVDCIDFQPLRDKGSNVPIEDKDLEIKEAKERVATLTERLEEVSSEGITITDSQFDGESGDFKIELDSSGNVKIYIESYEYGGIDDSVRFNSESDVTIGSIACNEGGELYPNRVNSALQAAVEATESLE